MPGSQTKRLSWLPCTMLFGGLLVAALLLVPQYRQLMFVSWLACTLGILGARWVGRLLPQPEHLLSRAVLEMLVRPAFPLVSCIAAAFSLPVDQARIFAASLVVFFLIMLAMDRLMFLAGLPDTVRSCRSS